MWSQGQSAWLKAKIEAAPMADCKIDGYSVKKGWVKVVYRNREKLMEKWIMPDDVQRMLRADAERSPKEEEAGKSAFVLEAEEEKSAKEEIERGAAAEGETAALTVEDAEAVGVPEVVGFRSRRRGRGDVPGPSQCKFCDHPVQPGLTMHMRGYDTCCRACANSKGAGFHNRNCGVVSPSGGSSASLDDLASQNVRAWFEDLLANTDEFRTHVESLFLAAGGQDAETVSLGLPTPSPSNDRESNEQAQFQESHGGASSSDAGTVQAREAWNIIHSQLLAPISEEKYLPGEKEMEAAASILPAGAAEIDREAFSKLCLVLLQQKRRVCFPKKLPTSTYNFVRKNNNKVTRVYVDWRIIGQGSFGMVHSIVHRISRERRVCKGISKETGLKTVQKIVPEIDSMASLDHPNIVKVFEYFEEGGKIYLIMEECRGKDLHHLVEAVFCKRTAHMYSEDFMRDVLKQTLRALAFMHGKQILHKDLKSSNIVLVDELADGANSACIKVIDFGFAELFEKDQTHAINFGGTLLFLAPEGFRSALEFKSDVWSVGVILYNLITGDFPFKGSGDGAYDQAWEARTGSCIQDPQRQFLPHPELSKSHPHCIELLRQMLHKEPSGRADAAACLRQPWLDRVEQSPPPLSVGTQQCLEMYSRQPELKKALFLLIAHVHQSSDSLPDLRAIFTHFDEDNSGSLDSNSLRRVLRTSGMSPLKAESILFGLDRDDTGSVSWTEFIAAVSCKNVCQSQTLVDVAFGMLDHDDDGRVSQKDILAVFAKGSGTAAWEECVSRECAALDRGPGPYSREHFQKYLERRMYTSVKGDEVFPAVRARSFS